MNCRQAQELSMKYFDNDLNDIENAKLKQHFKGCDNCGRDFSEMNEIMEFLKFNEIEPPHDFEADVMEKVYSLEIVRKKRTNMVLAVLYSITGLLLILLGIIISINLNGLTVFEALEQFEKPLNSWSGIAFTLYSLFKIFYNMMTGILKVFLQVVVALTKTYYYIFISLLLMLFIIQKMFVNIIKQGD